MPSHDTPLPDLSPWQQILLAEYQEVCKSHSGITDFRAKLLALLPIASGAGVALLVIQGTGQAPGAVASRLDGSLGETNGLAGRLRIKGLEAGHGSAGIAEYPWRAGCGPGALAR